MTALSLKYGNTSVEFSIENASSVTVLEPADVQAINDIKATFNTEVEVNTVDSPPLSLLLSKNDLVTIVLSDKTRLYARQDLICKELVDFLNTKCEIPFENIAVLISLGTHRAQTEEENRKNVTDWVYDRVKVHNHDYLGELVYVGTTSYGTPMHVNPLAVNRKVIIIGSTVHHAMAGYGGGRKSILPGIAGKETILANHLMCLHEFEERSSDYIGMGVTDINLVNLDMDEATALVAPIFGINIVMNKHGKQAKLVCGHWRSAWEKSCKLVNEISGISISEKADIVIASCGGYPKDISLYQGVKTLFNMAEAVKNGGTMIMLAECIEGGGAPDFFDWAKSLKTKSLDKDLRANFTIGGYIFYRACECINKARTLALTTLPSDVVKDMNIEGYQDVSKLIKSVDFSNKSVIVMPNGGSTVPLFKS